MDAFPLLQNPAEEILRSDPQAKHAKNSVFGLGYNVVYGTLWLTSQRLVFRAFPLGGLTVYPLSQIKSAEARAVSIYQRTSRYSSNTFDSALRLEFANGGVEYFIPEAIPEWAEAVLAARITAPSLAFTQMPPERSAVEQGSRGCWIMAGIFAGIFLLFFCSAAACLTLTLLVGLAGQGGG